jgi:hypothetical protein
MAAQVPLAITIDIQFSDDDTAQHRTFPNAGMNGFATPVDIAWKTDVNRYNSGHHIVVLLLVLERVGVGNIHFR